MAEASYSPNNVIDPATGFIENPAYPSAFDAARKTNFIKLMVENGLGLYETCEALGLSHHTLFKHYHNDPAFKEALDEARNEYGARLDAISKRNAMNPKSVIERIFQLKSIFPERYADQRNRDSAINVSISLDANLLNSIKKRQETIDIEAIPQGVLENKSTT